MEKYFGNAYRGDPGVPHAPGKRFTNIWIGAAAFSAVAWFDPYFWQHTGGIKSATMKDLIAWFGGCVLDIGGETYHDQAMIHEQKKWKEARRENKPYKSDWNDKGREFRDSYYFNWPNYFP
ncbi:hypothetical protein LINPERHAP2_LOCUS13439 [Linum perenne]